MKPERVGDLELGQDLQQERLTWRIERFAWVVLAIIVIAALLGLLGPGPLSNTTAGEKDSPLWLEYERFARYQAPCDFRVHVGRSDGSGREIRLWFNRQFIEHVELKHVDPHPHEVEVDAERQTYVFRAPRFRGETTLTFRFNPSKVGAMSIAIGLDDGPALRFSQFYFP